MVQVHEVEGEADLGLTQTRGQGGHGLRVVPTGRKQELPQGLLLSHTCKVDIVFFLTKTKLL